MDLENILDVPQEETPRKLTVLFVDDERPILRALVRFGRAREWHVLTAENGEQALALLEEHEIDVIVSDMRMPGMNGAELLIEFQNRSPDTIRILLTGYSDITALESAINEAHIYNYLTKPWDENLLNEVIDGALRFRHSERERERLEKLTQEQNVKLSKLALLLDKRLKERSIEVDQALYLLQDSNERSKEGMLDALTIINRILEWKEGRATGQIEFVTEYSVAIAKRLKFSDPDVESVRLAALMHRVGLLALHDDVRRKPIYALNKEEQEQYRQYPLYGEKTLSYSNRLKATAKIVRHHREFINGLGYPDGLTERDIPIASQVVGLVTDFYDAFSGQLDLKIQGFEAAKTYINEWAGRRHDKGLVEVLWHVLGDSTLQSNQSRIVTTQDLQEGMTLKQDLMTRSGMLLLRKGAEINESVIAHLRQHEQSHKEVFEVYVQEA
jgi:response regulator RpfG family c-di-GMP phosphodiesterase